MYNFGNHLAISLSGMAYARKSPFVCACRMYFAVARQSRDLLPPSFLQSAEVSPKGTQLSATSVVELCELLFPLCSATG